MPSATIRIRVALKGDCQEHVTCYRCGEHSDGGGCLSGKTSAASVARGHEQAAHVRRAAREARAASAVGGYRDAAPRRRGARVRRSAAHAGMVRGSGAYDRKRGACLLGRGGGRAVLDGVCEPRRDRGRPRGRRGGRQGALRCARGGGGLRHGHEHRGHRCRRAVRRRRHRSWRGDVGPGAVLARHAARRHRAGGSAHRHRRQHRASHPGWHRVRRGRPRGRARAAHLRPAGVSGDGGGHGRVGSPRGGAVAHHHRHESRVDA